MLLRARANKFLAKPQTELNKTPPTEIQKLVPQTAGIHRLEINIQNEELRRSQGEARPLYAKYADLFDFAPVGYFIFNPAGARLGVNLTGARLLGVRNELPPAHPFFFPSPAPFGPSSLLT